MKNPPMLRRAFLKSLQSQIKAIAVIFQVFFHNLSVSGCRVLSQFILVSSEKRGRHE